MLLNMVMFKVTICDLKNKDRNMADNIEHQDKGELVANCDRFYSHRLKASCATNGYFYKLYAPLQANCPQACGQFQTVPSNCIHELILYTDTPIVCKMM